MDVEQGMAVVGVYLSCLGEEVLRERGLYGLTADIYLNCELYSRTNPTYIQCVRGKSQVDSSEFTSHKRYFSRTAERKSVNN